ncbi:hypothetical protein, partial [Streptomyces chryseus]|uniref:hypothetical protein n=1 Tax=Streptomyces chryseus TaxID=68186 RepID=UPI001476BE95
VGAMFRGIGRGAKGLDPAHRKDGVALLLLGLALIVAAGTCVDAAAVATAAHLERKLTGLRRALDALEPGTTGAAPPFPSQH